MREPLNRKVKRKEQTKAKRVWTYDAEAPGLRPDKFWCHVFKALNEDLYYIFCDMAALREEMDLYLEHGIENNDPSNPFHQPTEEEYLMMKENFKGGLQLHKKKGVKFFDYAHFPKFMKSGTISGLICHNQFGYDLPTMERIFGITYDVSPTIDPLMGKLSKDKLAGNDVTLLDTLAMSRTLNPDRPHPVGCPYKVYNITTGRHDTVGTHGLEAWGFRVTKAKPPIKNWNDLPLHVYLYRCFEDVEINEKVFHELMREAADLANDYDSITGQWMDTLKLSQKVYFEMCKQERIGVLFDQEAAWKLLKWIDTEMERISEIVEPQLGNRILSPSRQPNVPQLKWKKNGELTKAAWNYAAKFGKTAEIEVLSEMKRLRDGGDPVLAEEPMKISNQDDLKLFLVANGWRPTMWRALNITIDAKKKVLPESEQKRKAIEYIDKYLRYGAYSGYLLKELGYKGKPDLGKPRQPAAGILRKVTRSGRGLPTSPQLKGPNGDLCPNLESVNGDMASLIIRWLSLRNRRGVIKALRENATTGWLNNERLARDGRLGARSSGNTPTQRQKHSVVVNVPSVGAILGWEMRSLFIAPPEFWNIGCDASGIEARVAGHFAWEFDGGRYAELLLDGDVHTVNAEAYSKAAGFTVSRSAGKNLSYAILYGATAPKIAKMLGSITKDQAQSIIDAFWDSNDGLKLAKEKLERYWLSTGKKYICGIDGRKIYTRSKHSLLNALFQSTGAIIMDYAGAHLAATLSEEGIEYQRWGFIHDEYQIYEPKDQVEVKYFPYDQKPEQRRGGKQWSVPVLFRDGEPLHLLNPKKEAFRDGDQWEQHYSRVGEATAQAMEAAGKFFNMSLEFPGEYKCGASWATCH